MDKPMKANIVTEEIKLDSYEGEIFCDYLIHCPVCDEFIGYATEYQAKERFNYCHKCGQRIEVDFKEDEDD